MVLMVDIQIIPFISKTIPSTIAYIYFRDGGETLQFFFFELVENMFQIRGGIGQLDYREYSFHFPWWKYAIGISSLILSFFIHKLLFFFLNLFFLLSLPASKAMAIFNSLHSNGKSRNFNGKVMGPPTK